MKNLTEKKHREVVIYKTPSGRTALEVNLQEETVWLTQKQMARLFNKDVRTVNEHIVNVFKEKELNKSSVIRNFRITASDGKSYKNQMYNLDVIISVGYRDGDFACLVDYLMKQNKLLRLLIPNQRNFSSLLGRLKPKIVFLNSLKDKLEFKGK